MNTLFLGIVIYAKTDQLGKAAAVMMMGNAEMYLGIVKKAIDRGK